MSKKKIILLKKFIVLIICILIVIRLITLIMARYTSNTSSEANVDTAFYVLNDDYQQMTLNLDSLIPNSTPYTYTFSISNEKDGHITETDMQYDLQIRTTTNLPLTYQLLENDTTIADFTNEINKDPDGTYFRTMKVGSRYFEHSVSGINIYKLIITFPADFTSINYQDLIELVEISVTSTQTIIQ